MLFRTKQYLLRAARTFNRLTANRQAGLRHERGFWDDWFRTKGLAWPEEYARRLDPHTPLADQLCALLAHVSDEHITVLDVGAGPLTALGKQHPSKKLTIVATDALAHKYDALLQHYTVEPPVRTIYADAERLTEAFAENSFDLCIAQNCVDHMERPLQAIEQMLCVVKPGCYVMLSHAENEADARNYCGLHQWNFTVVEGNFIMKSASQSVDVSSAVQHIAHVECRAEHEWVQLARRKLGN